MSRIRSRCATWGGGLVLVVGAVVASCPLPASGDSANSTTIPAPGAGPAATVTVSKTTDVVNESVRVTWSGFTPSSGTLLANGGGTYDTGTLNPVRVYECRGAAPSSSSDCYGSTGFPGIQASATEPAIPAVGGFSYLGQTDANDVDPDGPANFQDTVTAPDGTGGATIQIFTKREAPSLGCDENDPCSIVVVPNYGRPAGATEDRMDAPWAWARRVVVPLSFAPIGLACPFSGSALPVEGAPTTARMFASWRVGACTAAASSRVSVDFTAIGEPQTRQDLAGGLTHVGLTTRPLTDDAGLPLAGYGYAPIAVSALVVAFQIDDANGRPVTSMRLDARLVAKLITGSYRSGADPNTLGNPSNLFHDPEFLALNPGVAWPLGAVGNHPILLADLSDLTWTLTQWINADRDARAFLDGKPDPYGMHVNLAYKHLQLPVSAIPVLDTAQSSTFQPIQGLQAVASQLSLAQFPGAVSIVDDSGQTVVAKFPRQNPGRREVIGIIDSADAAAYLLPSAALRTAAGTYVTATTTAMSAAVTHTHVDAAAAYPMTVVTYAAIKLHQRNATGAAIARLLDYANGPGQVQGSTLGELPVGYLPLPAGLLAAGRAVRQEVLSAAPVQPRTTTRRPTTIHVSTPPPVTPVSVPTPTTPVSISITTTPSRAPVVAPSSAIAVATVAASPTSGAAAAALPALTSIGVLLLVAGPTTRLRRRMSLRRAQP